MAWHKESRRHALASKGIKTAQTKVAAMQKIPSQTIPQGWKYVGHIFRNGTLHNVYRSKKNKTIVAGESVTIDGESSIPTFKNKEEGIKYAMEYMKEDSEKEKQSSYFAEARAQREMELKNSNIPRNKDGTFKSNPDTAAVSKPYTPADWD